MTAVALVTDLRRRGARLYIEGDQVVVEAPRGVLTSPVMERLRFAKPDIRAWLEGDWVAEDWQAYNQERAAIAEIEDGLPRREAERVAVDCTVTKWLHQNPPPERSEDECAACGEELGEIGPDAVPVLAGPGHAAWLHWTCFETWRSIRRKQAILALRDMGLELPEEPLG